MNWQSIIEVTGQTPIPIILIVSGLIFLLLAVGASLGAKITGPVNKKYASVIGVVLLFGGIFLSFNSFDGSKTVGPGGKAPAVGAPTTTVHSGIENPIVVPVTTSPKSVDTELDRRISKMKSEITYRLQEIRKFLYRDQMDNRSLYNGTQRLTAHGVGISAEFKNTELRTLLFELAEIVPENKRLPIDNMITLFDELAAVGPQAPFRDADTADPQKVDMARSKFSQIEREWLRSH